MKRTILPVLLLTMLSFVSWQSCNRVEETGRISFGLEELMDDQQLKSVPGIRPHAALVSIVDVNGQMVFDKEPLPLYSFGGEMVTKSLELNVGRYKLVEFMLADSMGMILWATPKEGSILAGLVRNPLPVPFGVKADETTRLRIEVVRAGDYQPSDFGYVSFIIDFVNRLCLKVYYADWNLIDRNDTIFYPDGTFCFPCPSRICVWTNGQKVLDDRLYRGLNQYPLPISESGYRIAAITCPGDTFYHERFTLKDLLLHRCAPEFEPLYITDGGPDSSIYITPEGLTEPTIRQGVFGRLTGPAVDSTNTGNYVDEPLVRDIYFYPYHLLDSLLMGTDPVDCLFPGYFPFRPLLISRSNTSGYFQAELDPGVYLYMVKEESGFYIDLFISHHPPGRVEVYEDEVTRLNIYVIYSQPVY